MKMSVYVCTGCKGVLSAHITCEVHCVTQSVILLCCRSSQACAGNRALQISTYSALSMQQLGRG